MQPQQDQNDNQYQPQPSQTSEPPANQVNSESAMAPTATPPPTAPWEQAQPQSQPQPVSAQPQYPPAQAPVAQPVNSFAQFPQQAPMTPTPQGSGAKKWVIIGAIAAAILLIVGIVIVVLIMSFSVSRQDFKASLDEAQTVRSAYSSLRLSSSVSAYSTETQRQNTIDTLKKDRAELDAAIKGLADDKAIRLDSGARERYEALIQKKKAFDSAFDAVIEAYEVVYPSLAKYTEGNQSTSPEARLAGVSAAREELEKLDVKDSNNRELVEKLAANFKTQEQLLPRVIAGRQNFRAYDSAAVSAYYAAGNEAADIVRDWSSNFTKQADDSEINKEINALGQYLSEKAS